MAACWMCASSRGEAAWDAAWQADASAAGSRGLDGDPGPSDVRQSPRAHMATGRLQSLPQVAPLEEHLASALRRTARLQPSKATRKSSRRDIALQAQRLDALTKELAVPLGRYIKGFPSPERLHPFEAALLDLTVGTGRYDRTLQRVDALRKRILEEGKAAAARANRCTNIKDAEAAHAAASSSLSSAFRKEQDALDKLLYYAKQLRRLPVVDLSLPTFVLVGAPNVGKSSIVQRLSSGKPEICDYPFTTKGIKLGHFMAAPIPASGGDGSGSGAAPSMGLTRFQVTDTPGLLRRPDGERNAMESLTLAACAHLRSPALVFVMDLSGRSGTTVDDQLAIRRELRGRFPPPKQKEGGEEEGGGGGGLRVDRRAGQGGPRGGLGEGG